MPPSTPLLRQDSDVLVVHVQADLMFLAARGFQSPAIVQAASSDPDDVVWTVQGDTLWVWPQGESEARLGVPGLDAQAMAKLHAGRALWAIQAASADVAAPAPEGSPAFRSGYALTAANFTPRLPPAPRAA